VLNEVLLRFHDHEMRDVAISCEVMRVRNLFIERRNSPLEKGQPTFLIEKPQIAISADILSTANRRPVDDLSTIALTTQTLKAKPLVTPPAAATDNLRRCITAATE
jgi:hypothetical protein